MTREMIVQIWESEGAKLSGHAVSVREEREATCFIQTHGEVMSIARITKLSLADGFISLHNAKDEHFIFPYDAVLGFKISTTAAPKDRPAGFR